ncbi:MAG: hypothetical protein GX895_10370 [Clostridiales bacterium]|uniref:hypothetical protein n=1 Tax=Clostridium sp. N3C TaxID=1776758 RepID=UPI00092E007E|nr:hypothetical protein [Clostridium sp. N3C]NLZ49166.1 hypothetical protein [Clostridiales bacterium]SCN24473.1 hypothetical protein N3C_1824 [Clostridium sp. N3C]
MAYINLSITEVLGFMDNNLEYNRDRIKNISLINDSQIEITVSLGRFFPDMKVLVSYNSYINGKLYFNIITKGGIKVLLGLMNEMGGKKINEFIKLDNDRVEIDVDKLISNSLKGVKVRDINFTGQQIYVTVDFSKSPRAL